MSSATAVYLGRCYQAIKQLERLELLDGTSARRAYRRLVIKASDTGHGISRVDNKGKPLRHAIRIHWTSVAGLRMSRVFNDYDDESN